jgi:repressor LexA
MEDFNLNPKNLVFFRNLLGMSQGDLADALHLSRASIALYEGGGRNPKRKTLLQMAELFGCTTETLTGRDLDTNDLQGNTRRSSDTAIPAPIVEVADLLAGNSTFKGKSCVFVSKDITIKYRNVKALNVVETTLAPTISVGDTLIVAPADDVESGNIVVATVAGSALFCKVDFKDGCLELSTDKETKIYTAEDVDTLPVIIAGKIIEIRKEL